MSIGRYAPSPTGDLHLGNLRTAILAWLFAHHGPAAQPAQLLYRIEDLDPSRVRPGIAEQQRRDLESLGVQFDPPELVQSERLDHYAEILAGIAESTYPCFCTRKEIAEAASAPHGQLGRYPGTCRDLDSRAVAKHALTRTPALRLRSEPVEVSVRDVLHGVVTGQPDDVVLRRVDQYPAYHLAVVVDDAESGVDQVVRGDDLLDSAIHQAYLADVLGYSRPTYAHVPLAVGPTGQRLAKRDGAVTLADLADQGIGGERVLTRIAASLNLINAERALTEEPLALADLLLVFDPEVLPRTPWVVG